MKDSFVSGRLPEMCRCPKCNGRLDGFTSIDSASMPDAGSISICSYCKNINVFVVLNGSVSLRSATAIELEEFKKHPIWQKIQIALKVVGNLMEVKQSKEN